MDLFTPERIERYDFWKPPTPPSLHAVKEIVLDFETDGLKWWDGNKPVGVGYSLPDGTTGYLPWGHACGNQLPKENVVCWLRDLRGVHITNLSTRFEVHMAQTIGVDFEEQGCTVSDVSHWAALLDDHRKRFALEELCESYLPDEKKVLAVGGEVLDGSKMAEYPSGMIAVRAEADCRQVRELMKVLEPQLIEQDLMRVKQLEDDCIFAACEMERNALPLDLSLLKQWVDESQQRYLRYLFNIERETGIDFNPGSSKSWGELFYKLNINWFERTKTGQFVTTDDLIKHIDHPVIKMARAAGKLKDLKSDFIDKYYKTFDKQGLLRFALHQLKSDEGGTVTGRFSASAIKIGKEQIGANPQQVPDINKQREKGHDTDFLIRRLFIPLEGQFLSADAKQIEYRLFADYARNPRVMAAYEKDPDTSFHRLIHSMILQQKPDLSYEQQKNVNFMKIYAGGMAKLAFMLGYINGVQLAQLQSQYPRGVPKDHPLLTEARVINEIYERELPEVGPLLNRAVHLAKDRCDKYCDPHDELHKEPHRGFVRTLDGRRGRFPRVFGQQQRLHKALNTIIQGGAASIMKRKMVEVHRERKRIGFVPRCTNHDEIIGDALGGDETKRMIAEVLNQQSFPQLKIPILWDVKLGANWADC